jgi:hypothetical protein
MEYCLRLFPSECTERMNPLKNQLACCLKLCKANGRLRTEKPRSAIYSETFAALLRVRHFWKTRILWCLYLHISLQLAENLDGVFR